MLSCYFFVLMNEVSNALKIDVGKEFSYEISNN